MILAEIKLPQRSSHEIIKFFKQAFGLFLIFIICILYGIIFKSEYELYNISIGLICLGFCVKFMGIKIYQELKFHTNRDTKLLLYCDNFEVQENGTKTKKFFKDKINSFEIQRSDIGFDGYSSCPGYGIIVVTEEEENFLFINFNQESLSPILEALHKWLSDE